MTGNTKKVAREIASRLNCDIAEINDLLQLLGPLGRVIASRFYKSKIWIRIKEIKNDMENYDIIILGTPVWASTMAGPVRSVISKYHSQFNQVAFFCTYANDEGNTFQEMEVLCKKKPIGTLGVVKTDLKTEKYKKKVSRFIADLRKV